jgi:hypothetical protein
MMPFKCHDCECAPGDYHLENCSVVKQFSRKPHTNQLQMFDTEIATITQRRGDVYGHPLDDFRTAADLMSHFDNVAPVEVRHALRMICVKLARLTTTPNHIDSYVDIVGYARCAVMVLDKYAQGKNNT